MEKYLTPELFNAILIVGLPVAAITFVLFAWAYYTGTVIPRDDTLEDTEQGIDDILDEVTIQPDEEKKTGNFVMDKWFEFGGGFYGLMVLITFLHLEFMEILDLGAILLGIEGVEQFIQAIMQFLLQLVVESIMNVINAMLWWNHWGRELPISDGSGFLWLVVSYVGYVLGEWLAGFFKKKQSE